MKRLLIATLSTLVLAAATPAYSQEVSATNQNLHRNVIEITPFNLVYHGYQGYFQKQGIPSSGAFVAAVRSGKVHAGDLVKVAIQQGRLSPETLNDQSYLNAVQTQLNDLDRN
jgi:glutamine cyclotransferase